MHEIIINIFLAICKKKMFCRIKVQETTKYPETEGYDEKNIKITKENTEDSKSPNQRKCTKSDERILNNLTISINTEINLRETRAIAAIKKNQKYFYKFVKNNSTIKSWNWTSPG